MNNHFITIAGNIGVGKSTLTTLLAQKLNWTPFHEGVADNPYLADFYGDMGNWSFHSQMFFLSQRLQQHHRLLQEDNSVIQDRSVYEDAEIFARNLFLQGDLSQNDWTTYSNLYQALSDLLQPPHMILYLRASTATLRRRINQRGRAYEQSISDAYLEQLNGLYDEWVGRFSLCPVLTIETDNLDYVQHDDHLTLITERMQAMLRGKDVLAL